MAHRRWRHQEHFDGPVTFGADDIGQDITFYTATADSLIKIDASADEIYMDGVDLWLKDDDQLEFGDSSDVVVDWDNSNKRLLFNVASDGKVEVNRNLTSGATSTAVMYIKQDNTSDDQAALQVVQDGSATGIDLDGGLDVDCPATYTSGKLVDIQRNLTSGNTDNVVVYIKQDHASDDQAALQVVQDTTTADALDVDGWSSLGYLTVAPTGSPGTGSVRIVKATDESRFFLAVYTGGSYRYIGITSTTTA